MLHVPSLILQQLCCVQCSRTNISRYEYKVRSLLHTQFQQVLLLDADNIPLQDPAMLFDNHDYQHYGNLFWPDFWTTHDKKDILYDMVGLDYEPALVSLGCVAWTNEVVGTQVNRFVWRVCYSAMKGCMIAGVWFPKISICQCYMVRIAQSGH